MNIIEQINDALKERGISHRQLAKQLGKHHSFISRVLSGNENVTIGTLQLICNQLGLRLTAELIDWQDIETNPHLMMCA